MSATPIFFDVGDVITLRNDLFVYEVTGNYMGALGQDSLIGLIVLSHGDPDAHGKERKELLVPRQIIAVGIEAGVITHAKKANLDAPSPLLP